MAGLTRLEPGQVFANDFRVVRMLAEGGMGAVYEVAQVSSGHRRALKILHHHVVADPRNRALFEQEARIGAQIQSDHVVQMIAAGVDEPTQTPWLVMEFLDGQNLAEVVNRRGALSPAEVAQVVEQLGDALGAAHSVGIVHRDLKPENIFVARSRIRAVPFMVKVLDFGISKLIAENKTSATATRAIGSPLWAAPEQTRSNARLRPATDVWALGLIAFYMLTGRYYWFAPHAEEFNLPALLMELAVDPIEPASVRAARYGAAQLLPAGFDAWFARCVVRELDQRFPDAQQAARSLLALLASGGYAAVGSRDTPILPPPQVVSPTIQALAPTAPPTAASALPQVTPQTMAAFGQTPLTVTNSVPPPQAAPQRSYAPYVASLVGVVSLAAAIGISLGSSRKAVNPPASSLSAAVSTHPPTTHEAAQAPAHAPQPPAPHADTAPVAQTLVQGAPAQPQPAAPAVAAPTAPPAAPAPTASAPTAARPAARATTRPAAARPAGGSLVQHAHNCMRTAATPHHGHLCVIRVLGGRASSEQELGLLATSYHATGHVSNAHQTMRTYLQHYPHGPRAHAFQSALGQP